MPDKNDEPVADNNVCNLCGGRGLVIRDAAWAAPCSCMRQQAVQNKLKSAQLTRAMLGASFKGFNLEYYDRGRQDETTGRSYYDLAVMAGRAAKKFVAEVAENPQCDGLLFTGPVGSGKTFLASCIANELLDMGREVMLVVVPDLLDEIRATYDQDRYDREATELSVIDAARKVKILILDDLGAHNYTEWTRNKIYNIINYRLNNRLPTVITTNLTLENLEEYLGERTTSRLIQMCRIYRLAVDTDIRIVNRQEKEIKAKKSSS